MVPQADSIGSGWVPILPSRRKFGAKALCCPGAPGRGAKTQECKTRERKHGSGNARVENTGVKNVARRKTQALYVKVFEKVSALVAQFPPSCAVVDVEEASVSAFSHVCQDAVVVGCWFHYAQAVMKRCNKTGLKESHGRDVDVTVIVYTVC